MPRYTIAVETDNAAFQESPYELGRILRDLARRTEIHGNRLPDGFTLTDINGNAVGHVEVER